MNRMENRIDWTPELGLSSKPFNLFVFILNLILMNVLNSVLGTHRVVRNPLMVS
jgi:hypothetical protein